MTTHTTGTAGTREDSHGMSQDTTTEIDPTETTDATTDPNARANREAAKYRTRLRETESERDSLRERLAAEAHAAVDRVAAEEIAGTPAPGSSWAPQMALIDPTDLARYTEGGRDSFVGEDGQADPDKVREALSALHAERPYLFRRQTAGGNRDPFAGRTASRNSRKDGFASAFGPQDESD